MTIKLIHSAPGDEEQPPKVVPFRHCLEKRGYPKDCSHNHLVVDLESRIISCKDCEFQVTPWDAMVHLAQRESYFLDQLERARLEVETLRKWNPILRAVKALHAIWMRKMLPQCPHCKKGIEAEALARTGAVSRNLF